MKDVNSFPWIIWDHTPYGDQIVTKSKTSVTTGYFLSSVGKPIYTIWTVELPPEEEESQ